MLLKQYTVLLKNKKSVLYTRGQPLRFQETVCMSLTLRVLMSYIYIYGVHILDVSRSHTTHHSR
jgi:hypothetical protein